MKNILKNEHVSLAIFFLLLSLILVVIWFVPGFMYGGGESALPFYNVSRQYFLSSNAWVDQDLGFGNTNGTAANIFYFVILRLVSSFGPVVSQAIFFFFTIFLGLFGIYLLTHEFFPNLSKKIYFLSSLFYLFNPITLVNVWNRFLYNHMLFWAALPFILFFFIKGLNSRKYIFVIVGSLVSVLLSFIFTSPAFTLTLWFLFGFFSLFYLLTDGRNWGFYIKYFLLSLVSFVLVNFWWLSQFSSFIFSSNYSASIINFFTSEGNESALVALSGQLGKMNNVLRFLHGPFFQDGPAWTRIYNFPLIGSLNYILPLFLFVTIYKYRRKREVLILGILFVVSIFLVKGIEAPLGELFHFAFNKLVLLQVFRNPFEKLGFLLPLAAAPLLAKGLEKSRKIFSLVIFMFVLLWGLPYFTRWVFTSSSVLDKNAIRSYQTEVPSYYESVNKWLKAKGDGFRFVVLPLGDEGITYNWQKPYSGVELSGTFFDIQNISFNTTIPFYHDLVDKMSFYQLNNNLLNFFPFVNARYLLIRDDIDYKERHMADPKSVSLFAQQMVDQSLLSKEYDSSHIQIYKVKDDFYWPKFYTTSNLFLTNDIDLTKAKSLFPDFPGTKVVSVDYRQTNTVKLKFDGTLISPEKTFSYQSIQEMQNLSEDDLFARLFYVKHLPTEGFYFLIRLREILETPSQKDFNGWVLYKIGVVGKRSVELYKLIKQNADQKYIKKAEADYIKSLDDIKPFITDFVHTSHPVANVVRDSLLYQWYLLNKINTPAKIGLSDFLLQAKLKPRFLFRAPSGSEYTIYEFNIPSDGEYQFLLDTSASGRQIFIDGTKLGSFQDKTGIKFTKGIHEIALENENNLNSVFSDKDFRLENENKRWSITLPDTPTTYRVSFDFRFDKGRVFKLKFLQDVDNGIFPVFDGQVVEDGFYHDWRHWQAEFTTTPGATSGEFIITALREEKCNKKWLIVKECKRVKSEFAVGINNFRVEKIENDNLSLISKTGIRNVNSDTQVTYTKINPSDYKVHINKRTNSPEMLVFSELYNSEWNASIDGESIDPIDHFLVNSYANGWWIQKAGDYDVDITFIPQRVLEVGSKISFVSVSVMLIMIVISLVVKRQK